MSFPNLDSSLRDRLQDLVDRAPDDELLDELFYKLRDYFADVQAAGNDGPKTDSMRLLFDSLAYDSPTLRKRLPEVDNAGRTGKIDFQAQDPTATAPTSVLRFAVPNASGELQIQIQDGDLVLLVCRDGKPDRELLVRIENDSIFYEE